MTGQNPKQKIKSLINDITFQIDQQPARKIIPKFYELAITINGQICSPWDQNSRTNGQEINRQRLAKELRLLLEYFSKFKKTRTAEIIIFDQDERYMYQQTERILHNYMPPIEKLVYDELSHASKIFIQPETYHLSSETNDFNEAEEEGSSVSQRSIPKLTFSQGKLRDTGEKIHEDCHQIWQKVLQYYEDHRLDQAYEQSQRLQSYMCMNNTGNKLTKQQVQLIKTIDLQYRTMTKFYDHFYDCGYTFDKQEKGISLWYRIIGQKDVAIKVQAEADITIQNFLCIASEIDLFQDYIPFTYGTKQLRSISRNQKIGTSKIYIPLLTDRQTYFYAAAYDRLRTKGSIFFFSKTINEDQQYQDKYNFKVPETTDFIRLQYKYYILEYVPITKNRGKIKMVSSIDLKMDYLPLFIINKSARIFSFDYMRNYHKINKNFTGSKWDKVKQQKKQLYDYFQQKIVEFLLQKNNSQ